MSGICTYFKFFILFYQRSISFIIFHFVSEYMIFKLFNECENWKNVKVQQTSELQL